MVETPQEWLYIRYHKKDVSTYSMFYLKLCDKVKRNRTILLHKKYRGVVFKLRRTSYVMMAICAAVTLLWSVSFGLHQQYVVPAMVVVDGTTAGGETTTTTTQPGQTQPGITTQPGTTLPAYIPGGTVIDGAPAGWPANEIVVLHLNEFGQPGAPLRNGPGISDYSIIEMLWDNDRLVYLHAFAFDTEVEGQYWLRVLSPTGTEGYISSRLVGMEG